MRKALKRERDREYHHREAKQGAFQASFVSLDAMMDGLDGRHYNNARILRWALRQMGEREFRELVYLQWRENEIDGLPRSCASAFMAKVNAVVHGPKKGGAR